MSHVFIAYNDKDREYAQILATDLQQYGFNIWIDDHIRMGDDWWDTIVEALENCSAFIVIMSPESKASKWVKREVMLADRLDKPMFPLLLRGENWPLFISTQYVDIKECQLPPQSFYKRLSQVIKPEKKYGRLIVPDEPKSKHELKKLFPDNLEGEEYSNLSSVFDDVVFKELTLVDLPKRGSNQHEINGNKDLQRFFGTSGRIEKQPIHWYYFADDTKPRSREGEYTFYDTRADNPNRSAEWRLYYADEFLLYAEAGDVLVLVRLNGEVKGLIFQKKSAWLKSAEVLFSFRDPPQQPRLIPFHELDIQQLDFVRQQILQELGLEFTLKTANNYEELVLRKFGLDFPPTKEMSLYARSLVRKNSKSPDKILIEWFNREKGLFRALEKVIVEFRLENGFSSVDEFIQYSLSVQNRRKSRMGYSFELQLSALFDLHKLSYERQVLTERNHKADFIFPGQEAYSNQQFDENLLIMLAAKSSCKERWRQILHEADRIPIKFLCTLETGISANQIEEMQQENVILVIPEEFQLTYTPEQRENIWTLEKFIDYVKSKQKPL